VEKLKSVKLFCEFDSFSDPGKVMGETGMFCANDFVPDSRIQVFQYVFDTLDPDNGGGVTYGRTGSLWQRQKFLSAETNNMKWKSIVSNDEMGSAFSSDGFTLHGLSSNSFVYGLANPTLTTIFALFQNQ